MIPDNPHMLTSQCFEALNSDYGKYHTLKDFRKYGNNGTATSYQAFSRV